MPSLRLRASPPTMISTSPPAISIWGSAPVCSPSGALSRMHCILLMVRIAALLGLIALVLCCNSLCSPTRARTSPVRDVERQPAASSGPTQGQGQGAAVPAPPPKAHTKDEVLGVDATNDEEPGPPPYYPVSRLSFFSKRGRKCSRFPPRVSFRFTFF